MRRLKGYTLIEILVGLTIIAILFFVGYVNFRDFSRRQAISGAGKLLQGDLRIAQQLALSGQKPTDANCAGTNNLNGYFFEISLSRTEYKIYASCSAGASAEITKTVTLPSGVTASYPSPNPILFKVLGQGTNLTNESATITLTQDATANTFVVTIGVGGDIR
jgi:prepilin-type N-terminal cleavage/methylation domain-containing protein